MAWKGPIRRMACLRSLVRASLDNARSWSRAGAVKSLFLSAIGRRGFSQLGFCSCFHAGEDCDSKLQLPGNFGGTFTDGRKGIRPPLRPGGFQR
jgi:hypothetical protein